MAICLSAKFVKTATVSISLSETEDCRDKDNCRLIALATACIFLITSFVNWKLFNYIEIVMSISMPL